METDAIPQRLPFTVCVDNRPFDIGRSCDNPLQLGDEGVYMPLSIKPDYSDYVPSYGTFTPDHDCTIELVTDYLPMRISCAASCDGEWMDVPLSPVSSERKWQIEGKKGLRYIFSVEGTTPTLIWAYAMDYAKGASCEYPYDAHVGKNVLPAAAGTYYYLLRAPRISPDASDNYIEVLSPKINLNGGSVTLMTWCDDAAPFVVNNVLALRHRVISNQYCLLRINRVATAAVDETFDIKFASEQPYDTFDSAPTVLPGFEEETPAYSGKYYYRVTSPDENGLMLNVKSDYGAKNSNLSVKLCTYRLGPNYVFADGVTSLSYNDIQPSSDYIIIWSSEDEDRSIPFTVTFDKAPQGDTAFWPLDAEKGENEIPAGERKYFAYTATQDGWLKIAPSQMGLLERVKVTRTDGVNSNSAAFSRDGYYQVAVAKGLKYTLTFAGIPAGASFGLSEASYGTGDTFGLAEEVDGSFTMNKYAGLYWYKYEVPSDGQLEISTNLKFAFGQGILEGTMSAVAVYVNNDHDYTLLEPDYHTGAIYPAIISVSKGDIVYLEIGFVERLQDISINLVMADARPGETPATAIVIENRGDPTAYDFPEIEYSQRGTWYALDLYSGTLEMMTAGSLLLELYSADDLDAAITRGGFLHYDVDTDETAYGFGFKNEYYPAAQINKAGRYLICIKYIEKSTATFSGSALVNTGGAESVTSDDVSVTAANGRLTVTGADNVDVFTFSGVRVASASGQSVTFDLSAGVYVVKAGGKVVKIRL